MKQLYRLQALLVLLLLSVIPSRTFGQFADPIHVNVRNQGYSFSDQFSASTDYTFEIIQQVQPNLGIAQIATGMSPNTLVVTFTPNAGAVGTTDFIVTYYTLTAPMHPVTRWYRFNISDEVVSAWSDKFIIDAGSTDISLDVLANDSITNGLLHVSSVSVSNAGTAAPSPDGGSITFTPETDFIGETWLQYIACDTLGHCAQGMVHILVRDPNAQDSVIFTRFLLNTGKLVLLTPFDDFTVSQSPLHGTLTSTGASSWVYTPDPGFTGKDTFEINLFNLIYRRYHVTVYQKNTNIHARNDKFYVRPGLSVSFNVLNNDLLEYDISAHTNTSKGALTSSGNGSFTYTPNVGYRGVDKFNYTTCFQDTVYCETATVYLHVTDLEPDNQFSYSLQTSADIPLLMDYPVDYTDFSYIISEDPAHGTLTFFGGMSSIDLPCETVEGFNLIMYEPDPGYTGEDHFKYYYCIQPSNLCYLVKVDMNVIDHPETEPCPCVTNCVWPGDTDKNGRVDMGDLLTLGNRLGDSGTPRDYEDPSAWFGQHASTAIGNDEGFSFVDADGNGTVTADDVSSIDQYYYNTNDIVVRDVQQKLPYQFTIIPVQYSLDSGDVVILDIVLGNANNPVVDVKGIKFSVNVPSFMMDSASVTVDFHKDSWLVQGSPFISLGKVPWSGRIDAGLARAQGIGASGHGVIATVTFIIVDDMEGFKTNTGIINIPITLLGGTAMDGEGTMFDLPDQEIMLTYNFSKGKSNPYELVVYPNPAKELVNVHINGKTLIQSIDIIDPQGRVVKSIHHIDQKHYELGVDMLSTGLYYLHIRHKEGTLAKLLSVIK